MVRRWARTPVAAGLETAVQTALKWAEILPGIRLFLYRKFGPETACAFTRSCFSYRSMPMRSTMPAKPIVRAAAALADANRVRILRAISGAELCVCELCDALGLTQSTLSTHLRVLRDAGLSASRKEGKWSYHRLTPLGQSVTEAFFGVFPSVLATDARLRRDQVRLERRLALRDEADQCCVGSQCRSMGSRSMASQDRKGGA
jgi:ArsR family transcriptional regulator